MTETVDRVHCKLVDVVSYDCELHDAHDIVVEVVVVTVPVVIIIVVLAVLLCRVSCEAGSSGSCTCRVSIGNNACGSLIVSSLEGSIFTGFGSSLDV